VRCKEGAIVWGNWSSTFGMNGDELLIKILF
jgi:hypothetical protein